MTSSVKSSTPSRCLLTEAGASAVTRCACWTVSATRSASACASPTRASGKVARADRTAPTRRHCAGRPGPAGADARDRLYPVCVDEMRAERDAIRAQIEAHGFNERLGSYTRTLDGSDLDASLFTLPLYGYVD